jgi:hypothetical protein
MTGREHKEKTSWLGRKLSTAGRLRRQGGLLREANARLKPYLLGAGYLLRDPAAGVVTLHHPEYVAPATDAAEREIIARISRAFRRMKEDQREAAAVYRPSSMWQELLDRAYAPLSEGFNGDLSIAHNFLANFGCWRTRHGIESTDMIQANMKSEIRRRYMKNAFYLRQLKFWRWFYNGRKSPQRLSYPTHGNQSGAYLHLGGEDIFVGPGSFFNEIYGSLLAELLRNLNRPVVADLGAGYGKLAYFLLRDHADSCFLDFDLPETLCVAAYYLMKTWPEKRVLLYGEAPYAPDAHEKYDLILMPSFEIEKLPEGSVDLFVNKNSLGEMTAAAGRNYVGHIARAARMFFHLNHDSEAIEFSDGGRALLGHEYPVPGDEFRLLVRYPDLGHLLYQGWVDYRSDYFFYLYERIVETAAPAARSAAAANGRPA